jgi:hypothetical protein
MIFTMDLSERNPFHANNRWCIINLGSSSFWRDIYLADIKEKKKVNYLN